MTNDNDTNAAMLKLIIAWAGTMFGGVTLSSLVLTATLIYTMLQIFILGRKLFRGQA